jgi:hypothetical protein
MKDYKLDSFWYSALIAIWTNSLRGDEYGGLKAVAVIEAFDRVEKMLFLRKDSEAVDLGTALIRIFMVFYSGAEATAFTS